MVWPIYIESSSSSCFKIFLEFNTLQAESSISHYQITEIGSSRTPLLCCGLPTFPQTCASCNCLLTMILSWSNLYVAFKVCEHYLVPIQFYSQLWSNTVLPQLWPGLFQEFLYINTGPLEFMVSPQDGLLIWNIFILLFHATSTIT